MVDKRRHTRKSVRLVARYISAKLNLEGHITDVSEGGLFFSADRLDNPGVPASVWLAVPARAGRIELRGEVRWVSKATQSTGMGIQFRGLASEAETVLSSLR